MIFKPHTIVSSALVALTLISNTVYAGYQSGIVGKYNCQGSAKHGGRMYYSNLVIKKLYGAKDVYRLHWKFRDRHQSSATGFFKQLGDQNILVASFSSNRQAPRVAKPDNSGVIGYAVHKHGGKHKLSGFWYYVGSSYVGSETCEKVR